MKYTLLAFLFGTITLFAQEKLVVDYEYKNEFDLSNVTDKESLQLHKDAQNRKTEFILVLDKNYSIYKAVEKINNSQQSEGISISYGNPSDILYKEIQQNEIYKYTDYNGRKFLIKDTIQTIPWNLTRESTKILGYDVKKATAVINNKTYEAWYTPSLNFRNGPAEYGGLLGLILKLEISIAKKKLPRKDIYQVTSIKSAEKIKIEKPTKGQLVTKAEFNKITDDMHKEFIKSAEKMDKKID
jgi:GLPGLI family protein